MLSSCQPPGQFSAPEEPSSTSSKACLGCFQGCSASRQVLLACLLLCCESLPSDFLRAFTRPANKRCVMQRAPRTLSHVCDNLQPSILNTVLILLQFLELEAISPSDSAYWVSRTLCTSTSPPCWDGRNPSWWRALWTTWEKLQGCTPYHTAWRGEHTYRQLA